MEVLSQSQIDDLLNSLTSGGEPVSNGDLLIPVDTVDKMIKMLENIKSNFKDKKASETKSTNSSFEVMSQSQIDDLFDEFRSFLKTKDEKNVHDDHVDAMALAFYNSKVHRATIHNPDIAPQFGIPRDFTDESMIHFITDAASRGEIQGQEDILLEELTELTKAILKYRRGKGQLQSIAEEMSHVAMSMALVARLNRISNGMINAEIAKKIKEYSFERNYEYLG